ncbi:beta-ketoacyl-[acyl-carrier-protein] synthase family protein [Adhaeretor mobilis]|uniref:3-oxoacyl-[acyl-carrier-protein] synthase 2 n=1 Tax=Adhaeretor mobilis TaxID=1930276 RepID=A0A517N031_9BACT|nr:beta-ketoacyl synthase N-terminal-like domain-containing protein [Adhaeretor mobilis]QDT00464.1 3-oxoacyl-[acyl-carrier-protein] synthase 2 [Adhaeretor mobilis]
MSASNSSRRVVITGMGVVSPLGNSPAALWESLCAGRSGVAPLGLLPPLAGRVVYAGEARDFTGEIGDFGELTKDRKKVIRKALKMMCRETMMAVSAAQQAMVDAGFGEAVPDPERSGVVFGSDYMLSPPDDFLDGMNKCGADEADFKFDQWGPTGLPEMNPLWMLKFLPNMPASHIAIFNDLRGPNNSLTLREVAGLMAIREATHTIARGHADRMLAGACGTRVHSFKTIHAVQTEQLADPTLDPTTASRPFDAARTGMVVGEGAGALVLEEREAALARGATIYGEILGAGSSVATDVDLKARPEESLEHAAAAALDDASLEFDALGHISAHGLGTTKADAAEAKALRSLGGETGSEASVVAAKSYFGNLGAASSVVELVASVMALGEGKLFETLNFQSPDENCPVSIASEGSPAGESFLKLSVTPQGQAAALVVGRG